MVLLNDAWQRISTSKRLSAVGERTSNDVAGKRQTLPGQAGQRCNEQRGWHGLKGACVRAKASAGPEVIASAVKESKLALAAKIKAQRSASTTKQKTTTTARAETRPDLLAPVSSSRLAVANALANVRPPGGAGRPGNRKETPEEALAAKAEARAFFAARGWPNEGRAQRLQRQEAQRAIAQPFIERDVLRKEGRDPALVPVPDDNPYSRSSRAARQRGIDQRKALAVSAAASPSLPAAAASPSPISPPAPPPQKIGGPNTPAVNLSSSGKPGPGYYFTKTGKELEKELLNRSLPLNTGSSGPGRRRMTVYEMAQRLEEHDRSIALSKATAARVAERAKANRNEPPIASGTRPTTESITKDKPKPTAKSTATKAANVSWQARLKEIAEADEKRTKQFAITPRPIPTTVRGIAIDSADRAEKGQTPCNESRGWHGLKPGCTRDRSNKKAKNQAVPFKASSKATGPSTKNQNRGPIRGGIAEIDPATIEVDPKRFQYKIQGEQTKTGSVGSLSGVATYDPNLGGILQVWNDPADGKTYVVNGHNRLDLAKKKGAKAVAVRYLDVPDAPTARAVGALTNIAEGRGTALDAGKFFRDTGFTRDEIVAKGIPMREKIATDGIALSKLDATLFRQVIDGRLTANRGVIIGGSGLSEAKQRDLATLIGAKEKRYGLTDASIQELAAIAKSAETGSQQTMTLFGLETTETSNVIEKAKLQASLKAKLSREKKLFGTVSRSRAAEDLKRGGNTIDIGQSKALATEAQLALATFDRFKNLSGPIASQLNTAATRIANGEKAQLVEKEIYADILRLVAAESGTKIGSAN